MNKTILVIAISLVVLFLSSCAGPQMMLVKSHPSTDVYDGWQLGMQAYSFRKFTFYEAVEKTAALGLDWIETGPFNQALSKEDPNVKFSHTMSAEVREQVKQKLKEAGVRLIAYGVVLFDNDEAKCRQIFDFARDMGVEIITAEPALDAFDVVEKLCKEYKIKVAIHNHPAPSLYWNPDKVLEACKGHSTLIGACADTGHWMRSGVNPLEALKKLQGRIISFHLKDLDELGNPKAHDVVWGTGKADVKGMLTELDRQGFKGLFAIEYEHNWENSVPDIEKCVEYFDKVAGGLKPAGWRRLLAKDLSNCEYEPGMWAMEEGLLTRKDHKGMYKDIWAKEKYGNFILDLEFKLAKETNSGVYIRNIDHVSWQHIGIEVQVLDSNVQEMDKHICGSIYDCLAPRKNMVRQPGEWNRMTIKAQKKQISVVLNGEQIIDMDLSVWKKVGMNPDGTKNKFPIAFNDMQQVGYIGFQDHGHPVWYRNIKIKPLDE